MIYTTPTFEYFFVHDGSDSNTLITSYIIKTHWLFIVYWSTMGLLSRYVDCCSCVALTSNVDRIHVDTSPHSKELIDSRAHSTSKESDTSFDLLLNVLLPSHCNVSVLLASILLKGEKELGGGNCIASNNETLTCHMTQTKADAPTTNKHFVILCGHRMSSPTHIFHSTYHSLIADNSYAQLT